MEIKKNLASNSEISELKLTNKFHDVIDDMIDIVKFFEEFETNETVEETTKKEVISLNQLNNETEHKEESDIILEFNEQTSDDILKFNPIQ